VVDDQSGMAIKKVDLELKTPDGNTEQHATRLSGEIESLGLQSGNCQVSSDLKDATVEKTLLFVGVGEKPIGQKSAGETKQSTTVAPKMGIKYIASIEEHKVKTGEMPNSIASSAGMTWQALAKFNWGSEDPDEVNEHLANDVGCTKKTADGKNYLFDDADQPGIIYIPKQWKYDGLDTGIVHTIRVKPFTASDFIVQLQTDSGDAIPEAQFEAELSTGEKRKGTLDRKGEAVLVNPPPGPVIVWYPDSDDVYAKTLAVSARRALDRQEFAPIYELLQQSPTTIQMAIARYDQYFNDYTGNGFIEDLDTVFTDPDAHRIVGSLLARAGVQFGEPIEHFDWRQQDGC
jgi:hypothetical protein